MTMFRRIAFAAFAAPLALGPSACNSGEEDTVAASEPIAPISAPEGTQWTDTTTVSDDGGYILGNPEAPIKLVEYGSLTCPACAAFSVEGAAKLEEDYVNSGRVSYEFRSVLIHGAADLVLTKLVTCGAKEAVHPLANQVWANLNPILDGIQANTAALEGAMGLPEEQRLPAYAEAGGLYEFFSARGLSRDQAESCLADFDAVQALAEQTEAAARRDEVERTPTFFLNGRQLEETRWEDVEPALQRAGAR